MTHAPRDTRVYLADIIEAVEKIERYIDGVTLDAFRMDGKTQDAVVRNLEVIGEAVKHIPDDLRAAHPAIAWRPAAAMRDFLIHEYPEIDADAVWTTVTDDLPPFKDGIMEVVTVIEATK